MLAPDNEAAVPGISAAWSGACAWRRVTPVSAARTPEPRVAAWPIAALIRAAGFDIPDLRNSYLKGPRPFTYIYEGSAHV